MGWDAWCVVVVVVIDVCGGKCGRVCGGGNGWGLMGVVCHMSAGLCLGSKDDARVVKSGAGGAKG
jgi:hypothetical protein